jgi:hypothetical protein
MPAQSDLTVAAIRELLPRLDRTHERMALMEDLAADPVGCLKRVLSTMKVGPSLAQLIRSAIAVEEREASRWSLHR